MSKIGIIISREYKTRVMKKSFIFITFFTPILIVGIMFMPMLISKFFGDDSKKTFDVIDSSGHYSEVLANTEKYTFNFVDSDIETIRKEAKDNKNFTGLIVISDNLVNNPNAVAIYSNKQIDIETKTHIQNLLNADVKKEKLALYNIPKLEEMNASLEKGINLSTVKWDEDGKENIGSSELALAIGMATGILIYFFIVIYGAMVLSGVVQEKTSRIVEVIISSVKPFELMLGKIIGIALVGLTQIFMWIVLVLVLIGVSQQLLPQDSIDAQSMIEAQSQMNQLDPNFAQNIIATLRGFDFLQITLMLIFYFVGGYLLYASFYAAAGSASDSETDSNQFTLPITIPLIFAFYAGFHASQQPDSALSFWTSIIPLTSPIVMMTRLPFGVPTWQIIVSAVVLIMSFLASTWVAGKIYRTGILMYGKKISWKEIWKWLRY